MSIAYNEQELMPAAEARRIVEDGENEKAKQIWDDVVKGINRAIDDGRTDYSGEGMLPGSVLKKLANLGYRAENGNQYNQDYFIIRW